MLSNYNQKVMRRILYSLSFIVFLSGCSLYRSEGRKDFESDAPEKISGFELKKCKKEGKIETWFNQEFPAKTYELVVAEADLEIWKTINQGVVEVRALQKDETNTTSTCTYEFASEAIWTLYKAQFIKELENNVMSAD
ncbi:hypothetical protein D3C87_163150 [compost metagenome]